MRISVLSLVPISVASVAVLFALSACGGGGSNPPQNAGLSSAASALSVVPLPPLETLYEIAVAELSPASSCPLVYQSGSQIVIDFGNGCYNHDGLRQSRGRVTAVPLGGDSYRLTLENFSWDNLPISVNGSGTINVNTLSAGGELRYGIPGGCEVRFNLTQLSGTVSSGSIRAQGSYYSPASGSVSFNADVTYSDSCDWPTGGTISLSAGGQSATVRFLPSCGTAQYTIGGQTETRNLDDLFDNILQVANPCGQ